VALALFVVVWNVRLPNGNAASQFNISVHSFVHSFIDNSLLRYWRLWYSTYTNLTKTL